MMRRLGLALLLLLGLCPALVPSSAQAQGCGPTNPNCIVPTVPTCVVDGRAASTAYVNACGASGGGPAGTVTSVAAGCGTSTFGAAITTTGVIAAVEQTNLQTGTTYTVANGDCGFLTKLTNAAAVAVTLPQANTPAGVNFVNGWYADYCSRGAGGVTITPTVSTINGAASLALLTNTCARVTSDGTNYQVITFGGGGGGTPCTTTALSVQYNNAGAFGCVAQWTSDGTNLIGSTTGAVQWNGDTFLIRDGGPQALGLENGTNPTIYRVYNNATTGERFVIDWATESNVVHVGMEKGTGSPRLIRFVNAGQNIFWKSTDTGNNDIEFSRNTITIGCSSNCSYAFASSNDTASAAADSGLSRVATKVVSASDGGTDANGWLQWAGEARLDADFSKTSSTALANVTGTSHSLTVNLQASRNYTFEISLPMVTGATAGGIQVALGGTATVTNLIADGVCVDGPSAVIISTTRISALGSAIVANTNAGTTPKCTIWGTFEVNAAGTFTTQFAQNASSATASTVKRGAYMMVNDAP